MPAAATEVTLLGFELEIVGRWAVPGRPPDVLRRARLPRAYIASEGAPEVQTITEEYRYVGRCTYRRVT